jgi:hypothetical protein
MRGLMILGILVGAGWYLYRKVMGSGDTSTTGARLAERLPSSMRQAVHTAASKVQSATTGYPRETPDEAADAGSPAETRAAAMAGMPAVQPPATIPGA